MSVSESTLKSASTLRDDLSLARCDESGVKVVGSGPSDISRAERDICLSRL